MCQVCMGAGSSFDQLCFPHFLKIKVLDSFEDGWQGIQKGSFGI